MPSSLVVTALIVAWLVVLVPVVARRRQLVPRPAEADLCSRVLRRAGGPASMEVVVTGTSSSDRSPHGGGGATAVADRAADPETTDEHPDLGEHTDHGEHGQYDEYSDHDQYSAHDEYSDRDGREEYLEDERDAASGGPRRSFRPGRGGFDPDAAAAAADARYAFRRRVAVGLIAVAVVSALAALVVATGFWWLHLATDLALVGYLVFLRRQTRLEEEIRERRLARLTGERRALEAREERQADHERRLAHIDEWGAWEDDQDGDGYSDDDRYDDEDDEVLGVDDDEPLVAAEAAPRRPHGASVAKGPARWAAPRTPARRLPEGLELVEDSDDDPAFHDLEADRVPAYRRAAGA